MPSAKAPETGLSPRVRGNQFSAGWLAGMLGSIPACAGEPLFHAPREPGDTVYPRVCGGTNTKHGGGARRNGLSPRVRGNLAVRNAKFGFDGSIPACAGEPGAGGPLRSKVKVYPRVCGGTYQLTLRQLYYRGLSPRVRGNPSGGNDRHACRGSIPACAGEPPAPGWR